MSAFLLFFIDAAIAQPLNDRLVVIFGDELPDTQTGIVELIYDVDINDAGLVAFGARTLSQQVSRLEGAWREIAPLELVNLAEETDPTAEAGFIFDEPGFGGSSPGSVLWNSSTMVNTYWPDIADDAGGVPEDAIWRFNDGVPERLVRAGGPSIIPGVDYDTVVSFRSNARNDIVFQAKLVNGLISSNDDALFYRSLNGPVKLVLREGDAVAGGGTYGGKPRKLGLAPDGSLWIEQAVTADPGYVAVFKYKDDNISRIVSSLDQPSWLPPNSDFAGASLCGINSAGDVAFRGSSSRLGWSRRFVAASIGGTMTLLWEETVGDEGEHFDGPWPDGSICHFTDNNEVIVSGVLASAGYSVFERALLGFSEGSTRVILKDGDPAAGIPGASYSQVSNISFDVNGKGQIAFLTRVANGGAAWKGLWLTDGQGGIELVAAPGQSREIRNGTFAEITNVTLARHDGLNGQANYLSENGNVAWGAAIGGVGAVFVSSPADVIAQSGFEDRPGVVVNTIGDADDISHGDGECDTGNTLPNDDAECSLRAAIQEINAATKFHAIYFAIPGSGPFEISPATPLPAIDHPSLEIRGPALIEGEPQLTINGSASGIEGLTIETSPLHLSRLNLKGFNSDGVYLVDDGIIKLSSVKISDNCGFGVYSEGRVRVDDTAGGASLIENNGSGPSCEGGGIFSNMESNSFQSVEVIGSTISANNGPGILSAGNIQLSRVMIEANKGQGVYGDGPGTNINVILGNTTIQGNESYGIEIRQGDFEVKFGANVIINLNHSWGLFTDAEGGINFGSALKIPELTSQIQQNGLMAGDCDFWFIGDSGPERSTGLCQGGGIFSSAGSGEFHRLANMEIDDNGGPGIAVSTLLKLRDVSIKRNLGPGIQIFLTINSPPPGNPVLHSEVGINEILNNRGHGIEAGFGQLKADLGVGFSIDNNAGWGIVNYSGTVVFGTTNDKPDVSRSITGNGFGGECHFWDYDDISGLLLRDEGQTGACPGGGVFNDSFTSEVSFFDASSISNNNGPGILTNTKVKLSRAIISGNQASGIHVVDTDDGAFNFENMVFANVDQNTISNNLGHGIHVEIGGVKFEHKVNIEQNLGHGILVDDGDVDLAHVSLVKEKEISTNGPGGACTVWTIPADTFNWEFQAGTCASGGVTTLTGDILGRDLSVKTNSGDGLNAAVDINLSDSQVCDNTGTQIVAGGVANLSNVSEVCD